MLDATGVGIPVSANADGLVWRSSADVLFSFSADTTVSTLGAVQDEDVVRRTGTTWSVYFDGTARGLTATSPGHRRVRHPVTRTGAGTPPAPVREEHHR